MTDMPDEVPVRAVYQRVIDAVNSGNVDAYVACFAEDGMLMPPGQPIVIGKQAIKAWIAGLFNEFNATVSCTTQEFRIATDWAFNRHKYVLTAIPKQAGTPLVERGKAINIFKKMADGSWRAYIDCWNADSEPTGS